MRGTTVPKQSCGGQGIARHLSDARNDTADMKTEQYRRSKVKAQMTNEAQDPNDNVK